MNNIPEYMILLPAYGRDYKSKKEILKDFHDNKDFIYVNLGRNVYINKEQIEPGTTIEFRYGRMMKLALYKVQEKEEP
jgi:transposase